MAFSEIIRSAIFASRFVEMKADGGVTKKGKCKVVRLSVACEARQKEKRHQLNLQPVNLKDSVRF